VRLQRRENGLGFDVRAMVVAGIVAFLATGAIAASPGWSPPATLSAPALSYFQVHTAVAVGPAEAVAVWENLPSGTIQLSTRSMTSAWSGAIDISDPNDMESLEPRVAIGTRGDAVAIWSGRYWQEGPPRIQRTLIKVATRSRRGASWSVPVAIGTTDFFLGGSPQIALDDSGGAVAVWRGANGAVQAAFKKAFGWWSTAVDLSDPAAGRAAYPQLAMNRFGQAVAVWQLAAAAGDVAIVQASSMGSMGAWAAPVNVSNPATDGWLPRVAIDRLGRAVAIWNQANVITSATRASDGKWKAPLAMTPTDVADYGSPDIAMDQAGNAIAAWSATDSMSGQMEVQVVARTGGGAWSDPVVVSDVDEDVSDPRVAVSPDGDLAVVTWIDSGLLTGAASSARAATRLGASASWDAAVSLSTAVSGQLPDTVVQVAASPSARAAAIWASPIGFEGVTVTQASVFGPPSLRGWGPRR
jgi:hypothetical protein